jgi:hypothetical protein
MDLIDIYRLTKGKAFSHRNAEAIRRMKLKHYYIRLTIPQTLALLAAFFLLGRFAAFFLRHGAAI